MSRTREAGRRLAPKVTIASIAMRERRGIVTERREVAVRFPIGGIRLHIHRAVVLSVILITIGCAPGDRPLEIATTTSVVNSGLLDFIMRDLPGAPPRVHATGSGRSIAMLNQRSVDLVITHAPEAEERALAKHPGWAYEKFAYNHFVILGPASDPAGIRDARNAVEAFSRIAARDAAFVSRGDESGTHERELALWRAAGVNVAAERIYVSGGSMATVLRQADQQQAYTLSDAATWWQLGGALSLMELKAADAALLNSYAVIYDKDSPTAAVFVAWLISGTGRQRVQSYRIADRQAFTVWPSGCPGSTPAAVPCGTDGAAH